ERDSASAMRVVEGDVDMRVAATHFPLAALSPLLDPRAVGTLGGTLDLDLRLQGSSRSLVGAGRVDVTDGTVRLPARVIASQSSAVRASFDGNRRVVQQAHAVSAKGTLDVTGDLRCVSVSRVE